MADIISFKGGQVHRDGKGNVVSIITSGPSSEAISLYRISANVEEYGVKKSGSYTFYFRQGKIGSIGTIVEGNRNRTVTITGEKKETIYQPINYRS